MISRNHPKIAVTGLPGSGTTWLITFLKEVGYYIGEEEDLYWRDDRKGMEWRYLERINTRYTDLMNGILSVTGSDGLAYGVLDDFGAQMSREIECVLQRRRPPEAVKMPNVSLTGYWMWPALQPKLVLVTHRKLVDFARSWMARVDVGEEKKGPQTYGGTLASFFARQSIIIDALETHDVPYVIVPYPRAAEDGQALFHKLGSHITVGRTKFLKAWKHSVRPEWIGWSIRETERKLKDGGP